VEIDGNDEENQSIYEVGHARGQPGTRFHERNSRTRGQERRENIGARNFIGDEQRRGRAQSDDDQQSAGGETDVD